MECAEAPSPGGRVRAVHGPSCQIIEPLGNDDNDDENDDDDGK